MDRKELLGFLEERFGLNVELFKDLEFFERSKGRVFAINKEAAEVINSVKPVTAGLLFCRAHGSIKPTSNIIQIFGSKATKNVLSLDNKQAKEFIQGFDLQIENTWSCQNGYVIVNYNSYPLGVGLLKDQNLKNMLNKAKRTNVELL